MRLFRCTLVATCCASLAHAFVTLPSQPSLHQLAAKSGKTPEYIVQDGERDDANTAAQVSNHHSASEIRLTAPNPVEAYVNTNEQSSKSDNPPSPVLQYAALPPGTVVQIQVGDVGLARKAWKKRRRSGSPLLVPCSVLNVDRASTVQWNLIYLLEKFGQKAGNKGGVRLSVAELAKRYRSHLKTSLAQQATALGFEDPKALVKSLFNERVQKSYGVDLLEDENGQVVLYAPVSRLKAQKRANRSPVLQVADDLREDTLKHTGVVRIRVEDKAADKENPYQLQPLSAALRVNQKEGVESSNIQTGSMQTAVVFDYDATGDAGAPLITLSLSSAPKERTRFGSEPSRRDIIQSPKYMLTDLNFGDGPIEGKVVRFVKGGALIDCGIGRRAGNKPDSEMVRVLGLLKFSDAVEEIDVQDGEEDWDDILSFDDIEGADNEDEEEFDLEDLENDTDLATLFQFDDAEEGEEVEDITHLFTTAADGSLTYTDPDTGVVEQISMDSLDDDIENEDEEEMDVFGALDENDEEEEDDEDGPVVLNAPTKRRSAPSTPKKYRSKRLYLGDKIEVYVRSIAKQSNQLFLTMRSSVRGKKPKDIKQESDKEKKLGRLLQQVGGMGRIHQLHGREMDGIVKATSHTGDWLYVEPQEESLPVGIAFGGENSSLEGVSKGDKVRIQLEGIDETRGQLSMKFLSKVSP